MAVGMFGKQPGLEFTGGGVIITSDGNTIFCVYRCVLGSPECTSSRAKTLTPSVNKHAHQWV